MQKLLLAYHPAFLEHDSGPGHPEYPERIEAIMGALEAVSWVSYIEQIEARAATQAEVALVHNPKYVEAMRRLCDAGGEFLPKMEAAVGEASYEAAMRSVGAGLTLADEIMQIEKCKLKSVDPSEPPINAADSGVHSSLFTFHSTIGFAPTRPPGHHATYERPMGFCIFNNISVLAKYLQTKHEVGKVAIVDFDVHHGNGTEATFWTDPTVLYISLHRDHSYPYNIGRKEDSGEEAGRGFSLNIPIPKGSGDTEYLRAFDRYVIPKLEEFAPEFLLVSAGFDAHIRDPLGGMRVTDAGYAGIGTRMIAVADKYCGGKIISLLEGGYDLQGLAGGVTAYLGALIGVDGGEVG